MNDNDRNRQSYSSNRYTQQMRQMGHEAAREREISGIDRINAVWLPGVWYPEQTQAECAKIKAEIERKAACARINAALQEIRKQKIKQWQIDQMQALSRAGKVSDGTLRWVAQMGENMREHLAWCQRCGVNPYRVSRDGS